jgi:hypothetical protein
MISRSFLPLTANFRPPNIRRKLPHHQADTSGCWTSAWREAQTDFIISNVPLGGQNLFVRVRLDGRAPLISDAGGWSHWGTHQPATNKQLHFTVKPTVLQGVSVFPVAPITNASYTYDPAGQLISRTAAGAGGPGSVFYAYDAARNMTACWGSGFTNTYTYDHARRFIREISGHVSSNAFVVQRRPRPHCHA